MGKKFFYVLLVIDLDGCASTQTGCYIIENRRAIGIGGRDLVIRLVVGCWRGELSIAPAILENATI